MAGVLVTIAGVYELLRQAPPTPPALPPPVVTQVVANPALAALQNAERAAKLAEIRKRRAEVEALRQRGRCMDGVLIIKEGNEIRSAGRCQ